jgi:hypothetical protein
LVEGMIGCNKSAVRVSVKQQDDRPNVTTVRLIVDNLDVVDRKKDGLVEASD